MAFKTEG